MLNILINTVCKLKKNPLVSIIVPNYNHSPFLHQRIDSILAQTFQDFELILLDDCSTDNSREVLTEYSVHPKVSQIIFNETNSGNTFIQWNKGIGLAKGEYIWIAESDDYCEPDFLERMVPIIADNDRMALVFCQSHRMDKNGIITGSWLDHTNDLKENLFTEDFVMEGNEFIEKFLIKKNVIPNASGVVFRKEVALSVGGVDIDPALRNCSDWLFYSKILANHKVGFKSSSLNYFRYHSSSVIAQASKNQNLITLIDNDFVMREKMLSYFKNKSLPNLSKIISNNTEVKKKYIYRKAIYYYNSGEKIKGITLSLSVLGTVFNNINLVKRSKRKLNKIFTKD